MSMHYPLILAGNHQIHSYLHYQLQQLMHQNNPAMPNMIAIVNADHLLHAWNQFTASDLVHYHYTYQWLLDGLLGVSAWQTIQQVTGDTSQLAPHTWWQLLNETCAQMSPIQGFMAWMPSLVARINQLCDSWSTGTFQYYGYDNRVHGHRYWQAPHGTCVDFTYAMLCPRQTQQSWEATQLQLQLQNLNDVHLQQMYHQNLKHHLTPQLTKRCLRLNPLAMKQPGFMQDLQWFHDQLQAPAAI